jgi:hypothetical protein
MVLPFLFDESAVFAFQTASLVAAAILIPFFRSAVQYLADYFKSERRYLA